MASPSVSFCSLKILKGKKDITNIGEKTERVTICCTGCSIVV